jgi:hypothetical protein
MYVAHLAFLKYLQGMDLPHHSSSWHSRRFQSRLPIHMVNGKVDPQSDKARVDRTDTMHSDCAGS